MNASAYIMNAQPVNDLYDAYRVRFAMLASEYFARRYGPLLFRDEEECAEFSMRTATRPADRNMLVAEYLDWSNEYGHGMEALLLRDYAEAMDRIEEGF